MIEKSEISITTVETTKIPIPKGVDVVKVGPLERQNLVTTIVASSAFQDRVNRSIARVKEQLAESGFELFLGHDKLYFGPLKYGTRPALDLNDYLIGFEENTAEVDVSARVDFGFPPDEPHPRSIGSFHTHPDQSGFSDTDINLYEDAKFRDKKRQKEFTGQLYYPEDLGVPLIEGLISPSVKPGGRRKRIIDQVKLLVFTGEPISTDYQGANFNQLTIVEQAEILRRSGLQVMFEELPVKDKRVDFSLLNK